MKGSGIAKWNAVSKRLRAKTNACELCHTSLIVLQQHDCTNPLQVHHIKPWRRFPTLRYVEANLIVVCQPCHTKLELNMVTPLRRELRANAIQYSAQCPTPDNAGKGTLVKVGEFPA